MLTFLLLTLGFVILFATCLGVGRHTEIVENWEKYRRNPLYMFTAFLYKPEADPRSRWQFANDNFTSVLREYIVLVLQGILAPILQIFQITGGGLTQSVGGVGKIQGIMEVMFAQFGKITEVFERRFESILHRMAMTFRKLQTSLARMWGIAASTMYQSLAIISSILSTLDLIMKIVIIILVILVAIIIFLFLFLWPVIPVILTVIGIIATAGMGAAVGGMASTFCFTGDTPVVMADGTHAPIQSIPIGAEIMGGTVLGVLEFQQTAEDLFDLYGVHVSGSHIVYDPEPRFVADHPAAKPLPPQAVPLYCLITSNQRIPIATTKGVVYFADWEEIDDTAQEEWNKYVFETLNPGIPWTCGDIEGEAVFHPSTKVRCPDGLRCISTVHPGMTVLDAEGNPTRVIGTVCMDAKSAGSPWYFRDGCWKQVASPVVEHTLGYRSLFTEAGTFLLETGAVRDFSDVGMQGLPKTYTMVLDCIQRKSSG